MMQISTKTSPRRPQDRAQRRETVLVCDDEELVLGFLVTERMLAMYKKKD